MIQLLDVWHPAASMIPVFCSAPLENHIYVAGKPFPQRYQMVAKVFDASTETWSLFTAVSTKRSGFAKASYLEKIYVIGGKSNRYEYLKVVEVFDPAKNEWRIETSLPYAYCSTKAVVFQDRLTVFDRRSSPLTKRNISIA